MHDVIDKAWDSTVVKGLEPIKQSIATVTSTVEAVKLEVQPLTTQVKDIAESDHSKLEAKVAKMEYLDVKVKNCPRGNG